MKTQVNRASGTGFYFGLFMAVVYAVMGLLTGARLLFPDLAETNRIVVTATLLLYATYRFLKSRSLRSNPPPDTQSP